MDKKTVRAILLTAFLAAVPIAAAVKPEFFAGLLSKAAGLLMPVFLGAAIAFVMNIPVCWFGKRFSRLFKRAGDKTVSALSVAAAYLLLLAAGAGIVWIIVPQLISSVKLFAGNFDRYYDNFMGYCAKLESRDEFGIFCALKEAIAKLSGSIPQMLENAYGKTHDFASGVADILIGFVISIYILVGKSDIKKFTAVTVKRFTGERYETVRRRYRLVFDIFTRFVSGQITEAVILGVLCFVGMKLFRFEYALLISTMIGVTALIPVVGAIIGTIPSALLLFLISPVRAVWFVVFIIVLQQLENNLIYPRVVGKSLGIPPLLVLLAILLGAGIGGAAGMLLGVPLMSLAYAVVQEKLCETELTPET
ncbi:MAG: AI-2E family transporter [Prevotella sp.]|nr:AI-2E family transporter [Prevotella sp.]